MWGLLHKIKIPSIKNKILNVHLNVKIKNNEDVKVDFVILIKFLNHFIFFL